MLRITIFFLFILIVQNYLIDTVYTAYPKIATSSDIINDGSALGVPSQYGMCGISLTQMKVLKLQYNCNCRKSCQCNGMYICNWCYNTVHTKSNSMTGLFCKFNNWSSQLTKTFKTGNKQSRNERLIMCPQNHFITQVSPRIGQQGFNGIKIKCETLNFNSSIQVEDDYSTPLTQPSTLQYNFVTAFQLQIQPYSNLQGVKFYFEKPYKITKINFNYSQNNAQYGQIEKKVIQVVEHSNMNLVPLQKSLSFTTVFQFFQTWKNEKSIFEGYRIGYDISPNHVGGLNVDEKSIYYIEQSQKFRFGETVKTKILPIKSINAIIPSCYKIIAKSYVYQQKVSVPYSVETTLSDLQTDSTITTSATGRFTGFKTSSVTTQIIYEKIENCSQL